MNLQISLNKEVQEHAVHLNFSCVETLLLNSASKSDGRTTSRCAEKRHHMRSSSTHITVLISNRSCVHRVAQIDIKYTGRMRLTATLQLGLFIFTYSYIPTSGAERCSCLLQNPLHLVITSACNSAIHKLACFL